MTIDLSNGAFSGILVNSTLNINAGKSDINIINSSNDSSNSGLSVAGGGKLNIAGKGNSDINIKGNINKGIYAGGTGRPDKSTSLIIKDINDLNICLHNEYELADGIYATSEKVDIDLTGNLNIEAEKDKKVDIGINIREENGNDVDFDINAGGKISIKDVYGGITNIAGHSGETDIDISADSVYIDADSGKKGENEYGYSGSGIIISDGRNTGRDVSFNLITEGKDGININADRLGVYVEGEVDYDMNAHYGGSINIKSGVQGLRVFSPDNDQEGAVRTSLYAQEDINIESGSEGIESVVNNGSMYLEAKLGNINVVSGSDALRHLDVLDLKSTGQPSGKPSVGEAIGEIYTSVSASKNVLLSGKNNGIKYNGINSGKADIISYNKDVYIFGENNGIYIDSRTSGDRTGYKEYGNLGQHDINVASKRGNVYVGYFGDDINNDGVGISNIGRNNLNIEAWDLVNIQGGSIALDVQKETTNSIKGKNINFSSNGIGIKSEGVNNLQIGYADSDNNWTSSVTIVGNIGVDINANNLGKDDYTANNGKYSEAQIDGETNTTSVNAYRIDIIGEEFGLNISQAATANGSDDNADIYEVWKNNVVNIHAGTGGVNIIAQTGNAVNVEGINNISIKNSGSNKNLIRGALNGINLSLTSNLVEDGVDYNEKIDQYISDTIENKIKTDLKISDNKWNSKMGDEVTTVFNDYYLKGYGYNSASELFNELLTNKELQQSEGLTDEILATVNPDGDPIKEILVLYGVMDRKTLDKFYSTSYKDFKVKETLESEGCSTEKEYFDKLVATGELPTINTNIDIKDNFVLENGGYGDNVIEGGNKAFNIDGELTALVKGYSNYFTSLGDRKNLDKFEDVSAAVNVSNGGDFTVEGNWNYFTSQGYRKDLNKIEDASTAVNVSNGGNFEAKSGFQNIFKAGLIVNWAGYTYGNETAISVSEGGKATVSGVSNMLLGSVFADSGILELTSNSSTNMILSSTYGKNVNNQGIYKNENDTNVVTAVFATNGSNITMDAVGNSIYSKVESNENNTLDREITVWAEYGANVNISGGVDIVASNAGKYVNDSEGNARGVAVFSGSRAIEFEGAKLKQVDATSKVDINYTSVNQYWQKSSITGDVVAGYGGQVDIHRDKAKDNSLHVKGNILAANGGVTNVDFGKGGYWEGRADDYSETDKKGNVDFFDPALSNEIKESGKVNVSMENGLWNVTGQSWLTNFEGSNNVIDMIGDSVADHSKDRAHAVAIKNMNGEHNKFIMTLDNVNRYDSDMLYIKNGNGSIDVEVVGTINGLENVSQEDGLRFGTVGNGIKIDNLKTQENGEIYVTGRDGGFYNTKLFVERQEYVQGDEHNAEFNSGDSLGAEKPGNDGVEDLFGQDSADNLVIVQVEEDGTSDTGNTILDLSKVNYSNAVYMDRFNKRMGEARFIDGDEGIWVRMRHDRIGKDDAFRSMNTMYEIGYDAKQVKDDGEHRIGFAMDYMDGSSDFSQVNGKGEVSRKGLWMYDSWMGEKGHYRDFVAKWGHLSNDFEFMSGAGEAKGDFSNNVYSLSAEFGKKNDIGNNWYFEPQAQIQYAHVTGAEYATTMAGVAQTEVRNDAFDSLIARAGFRIGKDIDARSTIYFKGDIMHEFLGDQDVFAKDGTTGGEWAKASYDNSGTWYDFGFGYSTKLNNASYAHIDLETSFGNDYEETYQINAGVQWSF